MKMRTNAAAHLALAALTLASCSPQGGGEAPAGNAPREGAGFEWRQEMIGRVPPILMRDPLLEMLGQADSAIPYTYGEAVKLTGHSCMVVAAAWTMTRKALGELYPEGEIPVRGQIRIEAPGSPGEWNLGVFGQVMTYVTGAASAGGFSGSAFAKGNASAARRDKLVYAEAPLGLAPPEMEWLFTRLDTGAKAAARWDIRMVRPPLSEETIAGPGAALAAGRATRGEAEAFVRQWNDAAAFVLENADTLEGLFTVRPVP